MEKTDKWSTTIHLFIFHFLLKFGTFLNAQVSLHIIEILKCIVGWLIAVKLDWYTSEDRKFQNCINSKMVIFIRIITNLYFVTMHFRRLLYTFFMPSYLTNKCKKKINNASGVVIWGLYFENPIFSGT